MDKIYFTITLLPTIETISGLIQEYNVLTLAGILFKLIKEKVILNIINPQTKISANESNPATAIIVEVTIYMLYAGAVPTIPIICESKKPVNY